jgi:hypothetical protein
VKLSFKISFEDYGFEYLTEENLRWMAFSTEIIDLGSVKLNVKCEKP